jgi:GWxTD domain-containing protein
MALHESDPDAWLDGPVQYIILDEERDAFEELETTAERQQFIDWFWARRDPEQRDDVNPYRDDFYARVAEANVKYHDFPRGWRSDRGQVHVILGRPDAVRPQLGGNAEATVWTYYTVGPQARDNDFGSVFGEIAIAFVKSDYRAGYRIYGGFGGPGVLPLYVRDAFRYTKHAAVVDPLLARTAAF